MPQRRSTSCVGLPAHCRRQTRSDRRAAAWPGRRPPAAATTPPWLILLPSSKATNGEQGGQTLQSPLHGQSVGSWRVFNMKALTALHTEQVLEAHWSPR